MEFEFSKEFKESTWESCEVQLSKEAWMYTCRRPEVYEAYKAQGYPWGWVYIHSGQLSNTKGMVELERHRFNERDPLTHYAVMLAMVEKYSRSL